jgi:hypothetical protein
MNEESKNEISKEPGGAIAAIGLFAGMGVAFGGSVALIGPLPTIALMLEVPFIVAGLAVTAAVVGTIGVGCYDDFKAIRAERAKRSHNSPAP